MLTASTTKAKSSTEGIKIAHRLIGVNELATRALQSSGPISQSVAGFVPNPTGKRGTCLFHSRSIISDLRNTMWRIL